MTRLVKLTIWAFAILFLASCADTQKRKQDQVSTAPNTLCTPANKSGLPWHVDNLYDCQTRSYTIPAQLWSGARWNGTKGGACIHKADDIFNMKAEKGTKIKGPKEWSDPRSAKLHKVWEKFYLSESRLEFYGCHKDGIGRLYDSRGPRFIPEGSCAFPAGPGWNIAQRRQCKNSAIEITNITFDKQNILQHLTYRAWENGKLMGRYRFAPNAGMIQSWRG